jgi:hypothetical protein
MAYPDSDERRKLEKIEQFDQTIFRPNRVPTPSYIVGESFDPLRKRLLSKARQFVDAELQKVSTDSAFGTALDHIERQYLESAAAELRRPTQIPEGELREIKREDATGRQFSDFYGSPRAWMDMFGAPKRRLAAIYAPTGSFTKV